MTETGEMADNPKGAPEARRHLARLRDLAGRLDHQAALIRNGEGDPRAEARAGKLADPRRGPASSPTRPSPFAGPFAKSPPKSNASAKPWTR
jgi:hypothetical protein